MDTSMEERKKFTRQCEVAFIACSAMKAKRKCRAEEMYKGALFRHSLRFAKQNKYSRIFILSAKHYLISLDDEIEPYDMSLRSLSVKGRKEWAMQVNHQCKLLNITEADIFAGITYYEFLNIKKNIFFKKSIGYLLQDLKQTNKCFKGLNL